MIYVPAKTPFKKAGKKPKYRNKKVRALGRKFDSIIERDRWFFLQQEQAAGRIQDLKHQVRFSIEVNDVHICDYIADFTYSKIEVVGQSVIIRGDIKTGDRLYDDIVKLTPVVEDVKGGYVKLREFALKEKLMKAVHGVTIRIVKSPTLPI